MSRVTVTNPYDLLTDENEDRTNVPAPKKEQKPTAPSAKPAAKPAATGVAKTAAKPAAPKTEGAKAPAKTDAKATPKPAGGNSANAKPAPIRDSNQNLQEKDKESRAPRDKRDHRVAPAGQNRDKRAFDRKSGTGRVQGDVKKGGSGRGNWGGDVDPKDTAEAVKEVKEKTGEENAEEENKEEKVAAEGEKKDETKEETPAAEVEKETRTLDEYLSKKPKASIAGVEALKPRTVNAEEFGAAGLVALQRGEEGTAPLQPKSEKAKEKKTPAAAATTPAATPAAAAGDKKEKKSLAAELLTFASHEDRRRSERPPRRDYENRPSGERRPPRGAPRNGPRTNNNNAADASKPPVQEKDFPTLNVKA